MRHQHKKNANVFHFQRGRSKSSVSMGTLALLADRPKEVLPWVLAVERMEDRRRTDAEAAEDEFMRARARIHKLAEHFVCCHQEFILKSSVDPKRDRGGMCSIRAHHEDLLFITLLSTTARDGLEEGG